MSTGMYAVPWWTGQDSKARHRRRRGKKKSGGLFFSAWLVKSRNVYRDDCGSVDGTGLEQGGCAVSGLQISLYRECSFLGGCDILGSVQQIESCESK